MSGGQSGAGLPSQAGVERAKLWTPPLPWVPAPLHCASLRSLQAWLAQSTHFPGSSPFPPFLSTSQIWSQEGDQARVTPPEARRPPHVGLGVEPASMGLSVWWQPSCHPSRQGFVLCHPGGQGRSPVSHVLLHRAQPERGAVGGRPGHLAFPELETTKPCKCPDFIRSRQAAARPRPRYHR